ncbi:MAG: transglycosylase SLT domain-containing protein [Rikenellaceae bacterium]
MNRGLAVLLSVLVVVSMCGGAFGAEVVDRQQQRLESEISKLEAKLEQRRAALLDLRGEADLPNTVDSVAVDTTQLQVEVAEADTSMFVERDFTLKFDVMRMDSLVSVWREDSALMQFNTLSNQYINVEPVADATSSQTDSIYRHRLLSLASPVELPYHSIIRDYISNYTSPRSSLMSNIMGRTQYFFPIIEDELIKHNLPIELRSMAVIESALSNTAVSPAGAAGLWQFMPSTGKSYKLEINSLVDERYDPVKSTVAACQFMLDLYSMFGDWTLAIAAYNCGPGNVNKAIARSGRSEGTFWDVYAYLPKETRGYVPAFIAANYSLAYHAQHNITPRGSTLPLTTDTLVIDKIMHLGQVAETLELPIELLRNLNPQYRRDIIPATTSSYVLRLPQEYIGQFIASEEAIDAKAEKYLKEYINPVNIEKLRTVAYNALHVVKSGETLSQIADKYRVSLRKLMADNNIKDAHKIRIGQKIKIIK